MKSLIGPTLLLISAGAWAHHSAVQFDLTNLKTVQGTVVQFQWTNPHVFIQLQVQESGSSVSNEWSLEGPNPAGLSRIGWRSDSLKAGDKITVTYNPLRAGGLGGFIQNVILADGRQLSQTEVQKGRADTEHAK